MVGVTDYYLDNEKADLTVYKSDSMLDMPMDILTAKMRDMTKVDMSVSIRADLMACLLVYLSAASMDFRWAASMDASMENSMVV